MGYMVNGVELETDNEGYLLEPDYSDEVVQVIAAAEGITFVEAGTERAIDAVLRAFTQQRAAQAGVPR